MSPANAALARLYRAHAGELRGFARRRIGPQEADDVVQDAYLHLLQRGSAAVLEHPRPYLFRIAANLTVDFVRKSNIRLRYARESLGCPCNAEGAPSPEAAAGGVMEMRRLIAALAELPLVCREAFLLNRIEQLSHAEIARRLGVSDRTIARHVARALEHLRKKFGHGYEA